jgi:hypothetical protein
MNDIEGARQALNMYRIFDICVSSTQALAGLPATSAGPADWRVEFRLGAEPQSGWQHVHDWHGADGELQMSCARREKAFLLTFPRTAEYRIDFPRRHIEIVASAKAAESTVIQLLLDQVLPRVLFHSGRLVVHASAVNVGRDQSVAFLGPSGRGKSTLAAAYLQARAPILTDDCLLVASSGGQGFKAIPAYPALRLWPDSLAALELHAAARVTTTLESGKARLMLGGGLAGACPMALSALFVLGDPAVAPSHGVEIEPLRGNKAMMALIESAFVLDLVSKESIRHNFAVVSTVARSGIPLFSLNFPRRYEILEEVRQAVAEVSANCEMGA